MSAAAAQRLTAEQIASADVLAYAAAQFPGYQIGPHHQMLADVLEESARGECDRIIISMPPQHGKTLLASMLYPAWLLGRNGSERIIAATYSQERAADIGRAVRNLVASPTHQAVFPGSRVADDEAAALRFRLQAGGIGRDGEFSAVGRGSATTGRGATLVLIDDPIKDRMEADSELIRRKLIDWYSSVVYTRLAAHGRVIVILTRWHEYDLAGWLLAEHAHENWREIRLPALAEADDPLGRKPGAPLWPARFNRADLLRKQAAMIRRDWDALYQQRPSAPAGSLLRREAIRWYKPADLPERMKLYGASDYAVTPDAGDYTEHGIIGLTDAGDIYAVAGWYGQTEPDQWIEHLCDLAQKWQVRRWAGESGVIRRAIEPYLRRRMRERGLTCSRDWLPSIVDKPTRARPLQFVLDSGRLYLPENDWGHRLADQMAAFPGGRFDDAVDMLSLAVRQIHRMMSPDAPPRAGLADIKPFTMEWLNHGYERHERPAIF